MIRNRDLVGVTVFVAVLAGLSAIASQRIGNANSEAAVAAALTTSIRSFLGDDDGDSLINGHDPILLCVEAAASIDLIRLSAELSETSIVPIASMNCHREVEEGNFGMFTEIHHYFGPSGEEAGFVSIPTVSCETSSSCVIDLDWFASGDRYFVERHGQDWTVTASRNRWLV